MNPVLPEEKKTDDGAQEELRSRAASIDLTALSTSATAESTRWGNGLSVASLILGILALFPFLPFSALIAIPAIVTGHVAVAQNRRGKGMAIAGLAMGWISLLVATFFVVLNLQRGPKIG